MYWTDLHQLFRIVKVRIWVGMINLTFISRSLNVRFHGNRFWGKWAKIGIDGSFCALAFHNEWKDHNIDAHVKTADDSSTSDKKFGKL